MWPDNPSFALMTDLLRSVKEVAAHSGFNAPLDSAPAAGSTSGPSAPTLYSSAATVYTMPEHK